jgi:predicted dehydrogenase
VKDDKELRVGIVGCGTHGTNLALAVARAGQLRLVACADPDESAAQRAARTAENVSIHTSIGSLLEVTSVEAVLIATPHDELAACSLAAIRARNHVMVEKPMAMDDAQALDVESAAAEMGVNCMVGYSLRFSTGKYVHDLISAGHVGEVQAVTASIGVPPMNRSWMSTTQRGGGRCCTSAATRSTSCSGSPGTGQKVSTRMCVRARTQAPMRYRQFKSSLRREASRKF